MRFNDSKEEERQTEDSDSRFRKLTPSRLDRPELMSLSERCLSLEPSSAYTGGDQTNGSATSRIFFLYAESRGSKVERTLQFLTRRDI